MGYACPVCDAPQADAGHLANHLAFTAITSGGDHEAWLDEHVPEWGSLGESELAAEVVDVADETEYPQVFEASGVEEARESRSHDHGRHGHGIDATAARARGAGELDEEARAILEEARSLTEAMYDEDGNATDDEHTEPTGDDAQSNEHEEADDESDEGDVDEA